jgi:hypothetical protein
MNTSMTALTASAADKPVRRRNPPIDTATYADHRSPNPDPTSLLYRHDDDHRARHCVALARSRV